MKRHSFPFGGIRLGRVFWHAVSPSNSLVVTWENSPVNHDVNCITNFQAELFADGSFVYRYDDRTVGYAPVFSFDWDDDGLGVGGVFFLRLTLSHPLLLLVSASSLDGTGFFGCVTDGTGYS